MHVAFQNRWSAVISVHVMSKYSQLLMLYSFDGRGVGMMALYCMLHHGENDTVKVQITMLMVHS